MSPAIERLPPGPRWPAAAVRFAMKHRPLRLFEHGFARYGDVVRYEAPPLRYVVVARPDAVEHVLLRSYRQYDKAVRHPVMMRTRIEAFGEHHAPTGVRCDGVIVLQEPGDVPEPGARRLAEIDVPDSGYLGDRIIVSMAADDSADGQC